MLVFRGKADRAWFLPPLSCQTCAGSSISGDLLKVGLLFLLATWSEGTIPAQRVPSLGQRSHKAFLYRKEILHISD